jgi:hypothetical protein
MKYKIGDKLQSKDNTIKTVKGIKNGMYHMAGGGYWTECFVERKVDMFEKSDLKDGMVVVFRCGSVDIIKDGDFRSINSMDDIQNDLTDCEDDEYDIMSVYSNPVWQREEYKITIDGKDIIISGESFRELKRQLAE